MVTPWFPTTNAPESGLFVAREAAALASVHEVEVIHLDWTGAQDDAPPATAHALRRIVLRRNRPSDHHVARRIVRAATEGADIVHTHALTGLIPWLVGRPGRAPWVHSEHWSVLTSPEAISAPQRWTLALLRPRLAAPDLVIAESTRLADAIRRHRTGPISIVPCVVPEAEPARWPSSAELVSVGGLIPRKGPLLALSALTQLRRKGWDARLTWVGSGPLREDVLREAEKAGLSDALTLTGTLDSKGVSAVLARSRLFLLPTQGDNFCVAVAEALSHGLPVVSGAATGAVDYAEPTVSRFVEDQTPDAYARAIEDLLESTRGSSPEQVAETVAGKFTAETVRVQLETLYRSIGADDD